MKKIDIILKALDDVNLQDIEVYDMRERSPFFDYLIISSATSNRQLQAAVQHINDDLGKAKMPRARVEGKNSNSWVLVDTKDIVVNIFTKEEREFYDLEKMLVEIKKVNRDDL